MRRHLRRTERCRIPRDHRHRAVEVGGIRPGIVGDSDECGNNFRRLYEFVSFKITQGAADDIQAASKILRILLDGFESVREQANLLEAQGKLPSLNESNEVSLST